MRPGPTLDRRTTSVTRQGQGAPPSVARPHLAGRGRRPSSRVLASPALAVGISFFEVPRTPGAARGAATEDPGSALAYELRMQRRASAPDAATTVRCWPPTRPWSRRDRAPRQGLPAVRPILSATQWQDTTADGLDAVRCRQATIQPKRCADPAPESSDVLRANSDSMGPDRAPAQTCRAPSRHVHFCASRDGTRIAFATGGLRPPLVRAAIAVAPRLTTLSAVAIAELLAQRRTLIRYDGHGCGLSRPRGYGFSLDRWSRIFEAVVDSSSSPASRCSAPPSAASRRSPTRHATLTASATWS